MDKDEERRHILKEASLTNQIEDRERIQVYKRRWWVTVVFSMAALTQAIIWNTWGPIAESSELVFGWVVDTIAQITNMSSITFAVFVLPFSSFMDSKGLRISLVLSSTVLLVSSVLRCFTMDPGIFTPLAYLSAALHGVGSLMSFSGTTLFSATWFPVQERVIVTGVTSFFTYFGATLSFIIAPQLVPGPVYTVTTNVTWDQGNASDTGEYKVANMESMTTGIQKLMYLHASLSGVVFLMAIIYFPAKPPTPPSITAALPRTHYKDAYKKMLFNGPLWIVVIVGALPRSFVASWIAVFDVVVKPLGVSQVDAGWISFWYSLIGCLAGIVFAKCSDFLKSRRKLLIIAMSSIGAVCFIWISLLCGRRIAFNMDSLYTSCIILGPFVNGLMPLFYEMSAETAYPVGEGAACGFLMFMFCVFQIAYFGLLSITGIGISWMTWTCAGSLVLSLPLMVGFRERNKRYDIDT